MWHDIMILTATTEDPIVDYEWTVNGVIQVSKNQAIELDINDPDVVTVRGINDCGSWSAPVTLDWSKDEDMLFYLIVFIAAFAMFKGGS